MAPPSVSRAPVAVPAFAFSTTCFALFMLAVELATTPALFVLSQLSEVYRGLYLVGAIISVVSLTSGVFALCRSTPAAIASLVVSIAVTFAFVLLGGLCVIFTFDVRSAVASYLNKSLLPVSQANNKKLLFDSKLYLCLAASALIASALFHALLARHLYALVGDRRGAIAFLQTFSLIVFPFSLFLVIGGQYIVDTGTLASAPYTGIIVFGCGMILLTIALLSFIGGSFEYRRLLSMCCLLSYAAGTLFVGLSIAYFAMRNQVQENILQNWEALRVILPPTFQARYDRDQFVALIQTNLKMVAYVGIVCGLFVFQQASVCMTLMHQATLLKRQMAHDKQSMRQLQTDSNVSESSSVIKPPDPAVLQRHQWSQYFDASKRRQRIAMRVFAFVFVLAVALIFAVMCANVVFATKCHSIGKLVQAANFSVFDTAESASVISIEVTNLFTRGAVRVSAATDGAASVQLEQYGNAERNKKNEKAYERTRTGDTVAVLVRPIDVTRFLWLDGSCQRSVMDLTLPADAFRQLTLHSNASVEVRGQGRGPPLPLRGLAITTTQANINCSDVLLADRGLAIESEAGEIELTSLTVDASESAGVEKDVRVYTALGGLTVYNATFTDCDVHVETGAGTMEITDLEASATTGRSRLSATSTSGAIYANALHANWLELKNEDGDIFAVGLRTEGNSAFMGRLEVTNVAGDITMQQIDPRGSVHVESSSGKITLQLKTLAFAGLYYLRSDFGNVSIRAGHYGTDMVKELPQIATDRAARQGGINCDPSGGSCLSFGDLHVRSRLGDIEVILGCDSFQCT